MSFHSTSLSNNTNASKDLIETQNNNTNNKIQIINLTKSNILLDKNDNSDDLNTFILHSENEFPSSITLLSHNLEDKDSKKANGCITREINKDNSTGFYYVFFV